MEAPLTVTTMTIFNNNNTRMKVFPFFDAAQVSRIIGAINRAIMDETSLAKTLTTMYSCTRLST